jgi:hypothetical protein
MANNVLSGLLLMEKKRYLVARQELGGTALGYREWLVQRYNAEPEKYAGLLLEMLMESGKRAWERPARANGDDLFRIAGMGLPEYLTRPAARSIIDDDSEDVEDLFEKVDIGFSTVNDYYAHASILFEKAAQTAAKAERTLKAADEALRRGKGDLRSFLRDVVDAVWNKNAA